MDFSQCTSCPQRSQHNGMDVRNSFWADDWIQISGASNSVPVADASNIQAACSRILSSSRIGASGSFQHPREARVQAIKST